MLYDNITVTTVILYYNIILTLDPKNKKINEISM